MAVSISLHTQWRVLYALVLREIHTLYGHTSLGYIWAIIQTFFGIFVFWMLRVVTRASAPHGMSTLVFLGMGFFIWNIVSQTLTKAMKAISGNRSLLSFPQVLPLDIMIARSIVVCATQIVSITIIFCIGHLCGIQIAVSNVSLLLLALVLALSFGMGCGFVLSSLALYLPALENLVPIIMRILFFASGVFFSVGAFSNRVGTWLLYNPIMQLIEMARAAMSTGYVSPYFDSQYLLFVTLATLASGLLLERFIRRRLQA